MCSGLGYLLSLDIDIRPHDEMTSKNTRMRNLLCRMGCGTDQSEIRVGEWIKVRK